ncbi:unnamed protein product [Boreogadus saida]
MRSHRGLVSVLVIDQVENKKDIQLVVQHSERLVEVEDLLAIADRRPVSRTWSGQVGEASKRLEMQWEGEKDDEQGRRNQSRGIRHTLEDANAQQRELLKGEEAGAELLTESISALVSSEQRPATPTQ